MQKRERKQKPAREPETLKAIAAKTLADILGEARQIQHGLAIVGKRVEALAEAVTPPPGHNDAADLFECGRRIIAGFPPQSNTEPAPAVAQPEPDLLRAKIYNFSPEQLESARITLLGMISKSLAEIPTLKLQDVGQFIEISKNDKGCSTPAEQFITDLVMLHSGWGLTPDKAAEKLATFRRDFDDSAEITRRFTARYAEFLKRTASAAA